MKKLIMFLMVLAIAAPAGALRFPDEPAPFAGCANSGMVFWEFLVDGCEPTSDEFDPYTFDPALPDPTFGTRYDDGGPVWAWSSGDGGTGIYTCDDEDSINGSIPVRGDKTYMRMYFQVVHTLVESEDPSLIGMGLELWNMGDWEGCPDNGDDVGEYLNGYEFPEPTSSVDLGGGWWKSIWVADFSEDGSVWTDFGGEGEFEGMEFGLYDATHTTAIIAMGDLGGVGFDLEEVIMDYIWFNETDGSDIPDAPCTRGVDPPVTVDTNDIPIYEPQDTGGPPPMGPTEGQLEISLTWRPGEDLGYPAFEATVVVDPNTEGNGPNDDFIFPAGAPKPPTGPPNQPFGFVTLTFDETNWDVPQSVAVQAVEDLLREGDESSNIELTVTIDIADPNFGSDPCLPATRTTGIFIVDNDIPYISVLPPKYLEDVLSENSPGVPKCVNVTLSHEPESNVKVRAFIESEFELLAESMVVMDPSFEDWTDPNHFLFTPGDYNVNQTVCLEARDDDDYPDSDEEWIPGVVILYGLSDDIRYQDVEEDGELEPTEVSFNVQDNDCGAWGYDALDFNEDCVINLSEVAMLYSEWLFCTDPYGAGDECDKSWNLIPEEE